MLKKVWFLLFGSSLVSPLVIITSCASTDQSTGVSNPFATNLTKVSFNWNWQPYLLAMQTNITNDNKNVAIPLGWFADLVAAAAQINPNQVNQQWLQSWFQVGKTITINTTYLNQVFNQSQQFKKDLFAYWFGQNGWFSPLKRLDDGRPYQSLINQKLVTTDQFSKIEFKQSGQDLQMYCYIIDQNGQQSLVPFWTYPSADDLVVVNQDHFRFNLKIPISLNAISTKQLANQQVIITSSIDYQPDPNIVVKQVQPPNQNLSSFDHLKTYLLTDSLQVENHPDWQVVLSVVRASKHPQLLPLNLITTWLEQRPFNSNQNQIQYWLKNYANLSLEIVNSDLFITINGWSKLSIKGV